VSVGGSNNNTIGGTTVSKRNLISGNGVHGVRISNFASGNLIQGNFIGTDVTGVAALGNSRNAVEINSHSFNNTVGGTTPGARNIISGNDVDGVEIDSTTFNNFVMGNYIGTDSTGSAAIPNGGDGVLIEDSRNNLIGGTAAGAGNLISGNGKFGVRIDGTFGTPPPRNNTIQGNIIGLNAAGTAAIPNDSSGVRIEESNSNLIGGSVAGARNIISGNGGNGVQIFGGDATGNLVQGNFIGTDVTGTADLGNLGGIFITSGAQSNTIGGTTAGERNIISGNDVHGVWIGGSGTDNNTVSGNYIGIDVTGSADLGNSHSGIEIRDGVKSTTIGGTSAGERNVISGNDSVGVVIDDGGMERGPAFAVFGAGDGGIEVQTCVDKQMNKVGVAEVGGKE